VSSRRTKVDKSVAVVCCRLCRHKHNMGSSSCVFCSNCQSHREESSSTSRPDGNTPTTTTLLTFSSSTDPVDQNDILLAMCAQFGMSFVVREPFKGFPSCAECSLLYGELVNLFSQLKAIRLRMQVIFEKYKAKVVVSARQEGIRVGPVDEGSKGEGSEENNDDDEGSLVVDENCKGLREALLMSELTSSSDNMLAGNPHETTRLYYSSKKRKPYLVGELGPL
jgi:hypothetical protein